MNLSLSNLETELANLVASEFRKCFTNEIANQLSKSPLMTKKEVMQELTITDTYLSTLEYHGLKRIQIDGTKKIFYKRDELYKLMDSFAKCV